MRADERPRLTGRQAQGPSLLRLDTREYRYLLGVVWEAATRTTDSVRVGRVEKKFDDPARPDFWGSNWEVAICCPPTYSHFDLSTERYTEEPIVLLEDVTDTAVYSLGWSHKW
jgi:polysaccharide biosynthesis protein VpsM